MFQRRNTPNNDINKSAIYFTYVSNQRWAIWGLLTNGPIFPHMWFSFLEYKISVQPLSHTKDFERVKMSGRQAISFRVTMQKLHLQWCLTPCFMVTTRYMEKGNIGSPAQYCYLIKSGITSWQEKTWRMPNDKKLEVSVTGCFLSVI